MKLVATLGLAVFALSMASPALAGVEPKIVKAEFYEDLEDGRRYNVDAVIKGTADKVTARIGSLRTNGRLSGHIGGPVGRLWFFRESAFVKHVRADLYADGFATVVIKAILQAAPGEGPPVLVRKKVCELHLEPDPQFGDYASGDCGKV